jgi:hypothetical protein
MKSSEERASERDQMEKKYRQGYIDGLWDAENMIMNKISELQGKMYRDYPMDYDSV